MMRTLIIIGTITYLILTLPFLAVLLQYEEAFGPHRQRITLNLEPGNHHRIDLEGSYGYTVYLATAGFLLPLTTIMLVSLFKPFPRTQQSPSPVPNPSNVSVTVNGKTMNMDQWRAWMDDVEKHSLKTYRSVLMGRTLKICLPLYLGIVFLTITLHQYIYS
ncbi:MAG: hypothetical protein EA401_09850 [Planctomycetota bacterium]|nr:MAG: hypothetical protein EA401_09850 [Planctomycetota bacterium]